METEKSLRSPDLVLTSYSNRLADAERSPAFGTNSRLRTPSLELRAAGATLATAAAAARMLPLSEYSAGCGRLRRTRRTAGTWVEDAS